MLDVLLLLPVTRWLFQGSNDKGGSRWDDRDSSLSVLDGELDRDAKTFPISSGFGNIFTDLLGRQTERTNLRSKSSRRTYFTTSGSKVAASS